MHTRWIVRSALMVVSAFTLNVYARDVILHVALVDQALIDSRDVAARADRLAAAHPEARVESIVLRASMQDFFSKDIRAHLRETLRTRLENLDLGEDLVNLLVINGHGTGGFVSSSIEPLGRLLVSGPNPKFRETFEPLRGRLRSDARVVLLACSILAGETAATERRVEGLMNWLGATEGTLVGFRGSLAGANHFWRRPDPRSWDWLNIARTSAAATFYAYFMDWSVAPMAASAGLAPVAYQLALNAWSEWDVRASKRQLARAPNFNRGTVMSLRDGRVVAADEVIVPRDMDQILACESRLEGPVRPRTSRGSLRSPRSRLPSPTPL